MIKIVVDCFGGDNSPQANVEGAIEALKKSQGFTVVLAGDEEQIRREVEKLGYGGDRLEYVDAKEVISCEEQPTESIKKKTNSSMVKSFECLKGGADAMVSCGSTGALLVGSVLKIGRIKGVSRPALAPILPSMTDGNVIFMDAGANADCKPINLCHFALMGTVYMRVVFGIEKPRVGLLSNGSEQTKGNELNKEVYAALSANGNINFIGNVEARDILSGVCDVIVTDGFSGNIAIKSMEGMVNGIFSSLKEEILRSFKAKIGALLLKNAFGNVKGRLDYNKKGGAVLLGINKVIIKSHGASKSTAIASAIIQAKSIVEGNVNELIKKEIENAGMPDFSENGVR